MHEFDLSSAVVATVRKHAGGRRVTHITLRIGRLRQVVKPSVEILAALRGMDFGRFSMASRGEPRNQGFEYNWACNYACTEDMIATGQHTGLAAQVARGEVGMVDKYTGHAKTPTEELVERYLKKFLAEPGDDKYNGETARILRLVVAACAPKELAGLTAERVQRRADVVGAVVAHDDHRERGWRPHVSA